MGSVQDDKGTWRLLEFCLTVGTVPDRARGIDLTGLCSDVPERELSFRVSGQPDVAVSGFWSASHPFRSCVERMRVDKAGFMLLAGYPLDQNQRPIRTVDGFNPDRAKEYSGDFFHLSVDTSGEVRVTKSTVCSYQIYIAKADGFDVLASRASLAAVAAGGGDKPRVNRDFARWICTYGGGGNTAAAFENTDIVLSNQSVSMEQGRLRISKPDYAFLVDQDMRQRYQKSAKRYWDDAFDILTDSTTVLDYSDQDIEFPLSGGKDSRLLLGLILAGGRRDRISRIFTNGPPVSPDVRAAKMVCDVLGLQHEHIDATKTGLSRGFDIDSKLLRHVHLTEGETSPSDLAWGRGKPKITQLLGIESGLRNEFKNRDMSSRKKILDWFDIQLASGDKCQLFRAGIAEQNLEDVRAFADSALSASMPPEEISTLHRTVVRSGRWVGRTWRNYNDRFFAPCIFVNGALIKAVQNCGEAARSREEFHFEMMQRVDSRLVELPFCRQEWEPILAEGNDLKFSDPLDWPEGTKTQNMKNTHQALYNGFEAIKQYLLQHEGEVTREILDHDRLREFEIAGKHPSVYMAFWNFVQVAILEQVPDLKMLRDGTSGPEIGLPSLNY